MQRDPDAIPEITLKVGPIGQSVNGHRVTRESGLAERLGDLESALEGGGILVA